LKTNRDCNFVIALSDQACGVVFQFPRGADRIEDDLSTALAVPIGKAWVHVALDVSFEASAPAWSLSLDGKQCGMTKVMPLECVGAQTVAVQPGLYCETKGTGLAEVYLDNVEVR
jgi:hypothetical protein